ncbi:hypothetical protein HDV06_004840 [Boothiomyces sp. JEL0866]|nr:hypothetical protein HDV06_004840 [Boothiomyces sp. JEL0866]
MEIFNKHWQEYIGNDVGRIDIIPRYSEAQRHYHSKSHLFRLLELFEIHKSKLVNPRAVFLAIVFHDIVYDPISKDNELQSAELMKKLVIVDNDCLIAEQYILATIKHSLINQDSDLKYFLDFDLEVLSWDYEKYWNQYALLIRKEYSNYNDSDYIQGRTAVMNNFLKREKIYFTNCCDESKARENIQRELLNLPAI